MTWLQKIEALKPGDACEFHFTARSVWRPGVVVKNGGSSYWTVKVDEDYVDEETGDLVPKGTVSTATYIEHVRLPGQTEAWSHG